MRKPWIGCLVLLGVGCAAPPEPADEAPLVIADATKFIFENFRAEDPSELAIAVGDNLYPFILERLEGVEKPDDPQHASWYVELDRLQEDELGDLEMPSGVTAGEQKFPQARVRSSAFDVEDLRGLALEPNRVCLESETTLWARRTFTSEEDCWEDGSCDTLTADQETYKKNPLTAIWYDQKWDHRVIEVQVDGETREAMLVQGWIEERFFSESGGNSWDQIWSLDVVVDDGEGGSVGWNAYWTSLQVTLLGDDLLANSLREGLAQTADWTEAFLDTGSAATECTDMNLDRGASKPPRWENVGN